MKKIAPRLVGEGEYMYMSSNYIEMWTIIGRQKHQEMRDVWDFIGNMEYRPNEKSYLETRN